MRYFLSGLEFGCVGRELVVKVIDYRGVVTPRLVKAMRLHAVFIPLDGLVDCRFPA